MRHLLSIEVAQPKTNDRYRYDGQATYLTGPVTVAPDGQTGFPAGTYRIFYDAESEGEEYGFSFVVTDGGQLQIGDAFKRDPTDPNYTAPPDLHTVATQGNATGLPVLTGGYMAYSFPTVSDVSFMLGEGKIEVGGQDVSQIVRISLADLAKLLAKIAGGSGDTEPLPAYEPVRIWRFVPKGTIEPLPVYEPVRIWRFVPIPLAAPSNLTVNLTSDGRYTLSLTDNSDNETAFVVERSRNYGPFLPYVSLPANTTTSGFLPDIDGVSTYEFRARAVNNVTRSDWSNVTTLTPTVVEPITITQVRARRVVGTAQIEVEATTSREDRVLWRFSLNFNENLMNQFPDVDQPALGEPLRITIDEFTSTLLIAARPASNLFGAVGRFSIPNPSAYPTTWQVLQTI